ncbi:MAG TPA: DUF664 domain-containing protein [Actinophytocola sp.]|uniref:mycothiol transferase n=1 Tax=Actinophytocola sp. TaxID=1872138 RepID=UPI002F928069
MDFPEPNAPASSRAEVFLTYLDYLRSRMIDKVRSLPAADQRASRLPSGWTPLELLKHVRYVELRWIEWRFEGRPVATPWGDEQEGRWHATERLVDLVAALEAQAEHTDVVVRSTDLSTRGVPGPGWRGDPASLERILFHLLQEYARHLGHLDIVTELAEGQVGE